MTTPAGTAGVPAPSDRERIEGDVTRDRIIELQLVPVGGNFDAAHLREVNRRIFQDMPGKGFADVTPGQYRPEVASGDWMKNRGLDTESGNFFVAYSPMNAASQAKIEDVLKDAKPAKLAQLDTAEFTKTIAKVYAELDYLHPFADGRSGKTSGNFSASARELVGRSSVRLRELIRDAVAESAEAPGLRPWNATLQLPRHAAYLFRPRTTQVWHLVPPARPCRT